MKTFEREVITRIINDVIDLIDAYLDNSPIEHSAEEILCEMKSKLKEYYLEKEN